MLSTAQTKLTTSTKSENLRENLRDENPLACNTQGGLLMDFLTGKQQCSAESWVACPTSYSMEGKLGCIEPR